MSLAITVCYTLALLVALTRSTIKSNEHLILRGACQDEVQTLTVLTPRIRRQCLAKMTGISRLVSSCSGDASTSAVLPRRQPRPDASPAPGR